MNIVKALLILVISLGLFTCKKQNQDKTTINIMTYNIRLNTPSDGVNSWPNRKEMVASMIQFHKAEIIGVQEALKGQVQQLDSLLAAYSWLGVGRDDGDKAGEYMAIFYLENRFKVLKDGTFWLSETPEEPGLGWDAACNRVVTWGEFQDMKNGQVFYLFNTHFDHKGEMARQESAKLLLQKIKVIAQNEPFIVTGDFNSDPASSTYNILTESTNKKNQLYLKDTKLISEQKHHGPQGTFNGFNSTNLLSENKPIDYIFVGENIIVKRHGILSDTFDGNLPSDHQPVFVEIQMF